MICKINISCLLAITLICFAFVLGCQPKTLFMTSLKNGESGAFRFPTRDVKGFQDLMAGNNAYDAKGLGTLYLPSKAGRENKVAVMVILHGSGGEWLGRGADHADFLVQHGIGAFIVDTFVSRGLKKKDKYIQRLKKVNFPDQLTDAFAALEILHTHPFVDGDRIGVMGYSMGGISTILAAYKKVAENSTKGKNRFALHVPFYAPCIIQPENNSGTGAPMVCLWGEEDETTPRPRCEELIKHLQDGGNSVKAIWYPDAAHGWNGKKPMKFYQSVPNFSPCRYTIHSDGSVIEKVTGMTSITDKKFIEYSEQCVGFGYTIGRHDETHIKANKALLAAIETFMPEPIHPCAETRCRIGLYDSRAIAVAFAGSEHFNRWMSGLHTEYKKAKAAGNQKRVAEIEAEGSARQKKLHKQGFSTAPVDNILKQIEDCLPSIKQKANVRSLVSKWDEETLAKHPSADRVDVTMELIDALNPNARQRKSAIEIQKHQPIPMEQAEDNED